MTEACGRSALDRSGTCRPQATAAGLTVVPPSARRTSRGPLGCRAAAAVRPRAGSENVGRPAPHRAGQTAPAAGTERFRPRRRIVRPRRGTEPRRARLHGVEDLTGRRRPEGLPAASTRDSHGRGRFRKGLHVNLVASGDAGFVQHPASSRDSLRLLAPYVPGIPVVRKNDARCCFDVMRPRGPADIHGATRSAPASRSHDHPWEGNGRWAPAGSVSVTAQASLGPSWHAGAHGCSA